MAAWDGFIDDPTAARKPTFFVVSRTKCALVQINRNPIYVEVFETKHVDAEHIGSAAPAVECVYAAMFTKKMPCNACVKAVFSQVLLPRYNPQMGFVNSEHERIFFPT